ncbi:MAG: hypothetical protein ABI183_16005 [Polyangiaceae bacterium]
MRSTPCFVLFFVVAAACSSSSNAGSGGNGACGLALSGPKWTSDCQSWSDTDCCNEEKALREGIPAGCEWPTG